MIETTIPEIDVTELMARVRDEAAKIRKRARVHTSRQNSSQLPAVELAPAFPAITFPKAVNPRGDRLDELLAQARRAIEVDPKVPKLFRRLFRRQAPYNRFLLEAVRFLTKTNQSLVNRVQHLTACIETQNHYETLLAGLRQKDTEWMSAVGEKIAETTHNLGRLDELEERTGALSDRLEQLSRGEVGLQHRMEATEKDLQDLGKLERLYAKLDTRLDHVQQVGNNLVERIEAARIEAGRKEESLTSLLKQLKGVAEQTAEHAGLFRTFPAEVQRLLEKCNALEMALDGKAERQHFEQAAQHLRNLQGQYDGLAMHITSLQGEVNKSGALLSWVQPAFEQHRQTNTQLEQRIARVEDRQIADASFLKGEVSEFRAALNRTSDEEKTATKSSVPPRPRQAKELFPAFDSFYLSFEDRFRGPRAEIKRRTEFYLPFLASAKAGSKTRPILDVGCGRGEWLELLRDKQLVARGVDANTAMAAQCRQRELDVFLGDAIEYLRSLRAGSHGGVTGFHIIEHLPFDVLMNLFAETRRILKPGGIAIFESPNCKNLIVGACSFNIDPTHRRLVFPETAEFMLASQGFDRIQLEYLAPIHPSLATDSEENRAIHDLLYGPQDFAAIAYKPKTR